MSDIAALIAGRAIEVADGMYLERTNALERAMQALDDSALRAQFRAACADMRRQGFTDMLVPRAFAAIREASRRTVGLRHHDVQLVGGWVLLQGRVAEMATGEGKTL